MIMAILLTNFLDKPRLKLQMKEEVSLEVPKKLG